MAKAELAPIWHVTETKWGAVTQDAEKWIFLGNSNDVETTLDLGGQKEPPASGLELYQARVVPTRGLNVREGVGGRILRALKTNTIVRVYEAKNGWARIHPAQNEWVSASFLARFTA